MDPSPAPTTAPAASPLVARAARYYRVTRYIMVLMIFVFGILFAYDGWIGYPRQNAALADLNTKMDEAHARNDEAAVAQLTEQRKQYKPHTDMDLLLQKALGVSLPPLAIAFLIWSLYNSRGAYRLEEQTLSVPGHPPVPLESIRRIDKTLWDRKGIVFLDYELFDGAKGRIKLDDFVYDRPPTDAIFERIEAHVLPPAEDAAPTQTPE